MRPRQQPPPVKVPKGNACLPHTAHFSRFHTGKQTAPVSGTNFARHTGWFDQFFHTSAGFHESPAASHQHLPRYPNCRLSIEGGDKDDTGLDPSLLFEIVSILESNFGRVLEAVLHGSFALPIANNLRILLQNQRDQRPSLGI